MYIKLSDVKKHLNIDDYFTDDDAYLTALIEVAEDDYSDSAFTDADIMSMGDSAFSQADYDDKVAADDYSDSAFAVDAFADDEDSDDTSEAVDDVPVQNNIEPQNVGTEDVEKNAVDEAEEGDDADVVAE